MRYDQLFAWVCRQRPLKTSWAMKVWIDLVFSALVFIAYHRTKRSEMSQHNALQILSFVGNFLPNFVDLAFIRSII